jgi:peptidoglycan/xylan/chitin deacetylase (PgdA/CDA1 family)
MAGGTDWLRELAKWLPPGPLRPFGRPVALFFHGVTPRIDDPRIQLNQHDAGSFRAIARALKDNFQVLPLTALDEALGDPERHERTVFLMSDDGYANTLTVAADILEELELPWTLFASTHHIDTGAYNPMTLARIFFYYAPAGRYEIPNFTTPIELADDLQRLILSGPTLSRLKGLDAARADQSVAAMMAVFSDSERAALLARFSSESFLTWDGIAALADRGVEIGAHAHCHWPMHAAQSDDYLLAQARVPRAKIIAAIGSCRFFAYPFGNVDDIAPTAWQAVRDAGYDSAFTTLSGSLDASRNRWLLPRYGLGARDAHLEALLPLLRAGNARLTRWQKRMAA